MSDESKRKRVLGIDPGTKHLGMAVIELDHLLYQGVEVLSGGNEPVRRLMEARTLIRRLIDDFQPAVLAIEKTFIGSNKNAALLNVLADECQAQARARDIEVLPLAPSTVKKRVAGDGRASKREVADAVISRFPQLRAYQREDSRWKERYLSNMFDAVAIAMCAQTRPQRDEGPRLDII